MAWAGGVVIVYEDEVCGAVAVSGRPELDDHDVVYIARQRWTEQSADQLDFFRGPPNA